MAGGDQAAPSLPEIMATRAVVRMAFGVSVAMALAQGIGWSLSQIVPVFVVMLLANAQQPLSFMAGLQFLVVIVLTSLIGLLISVYVLPFPLVSILLICLALYLIFYAAAAGAPLLLVLFMLIAVTLLPIMAQQDPAVTEVIAAGLVKAGAVALVVQWVAFALLPPPAGHGAKAPPAKSPPPSSVKRAVAARATAVLAPLVVAFLVFGFTSVIVVVFAALLAPQPTPAAGISGAIEKVAANAIGGVAAVIAYNLVVAAPWFPFLLVLTFLVTLVFASRLFSGRPDASLYVSALSAFLILIGGSVTAFGKEAELSFYMRLAQIMLAGVYVAAAFYVLECLRPRAQRKLKPDVATA